LLPDEDRLLPDEENSEENESEFERAVFDPIEARSEMRMDDEGWDA